MYCTRWYFTVLSLPMKSMTSGSERIDMEGSKRSIATADVELLLRSCQDGRRWQISPETFHTPYFPRHCSTSKRTLTESPNKQSIKSGIQNVSDLFKYTNCSHYLTSNSFSPGRKLCCALDHH